MTPGGGLGGDTTQVVDVERPGDAPPRPENARLSPRSQLGRYVVLRVVGSGGMGTVYLGYDPELDRRVALKLLRWGKSEERRHSLLREAQAMARLAHPNVVSVFDAGEHEGTVYVAMEYVEGQTLERWIQQRPRSWRELLDKFLDAGRGLGAAHKSGLIHRDFKPTNVMVSTDERVQVMDFGLVLPQSGVTPNVEGVQHGGSLLTDASKPEIRGTPGYMAPEQATTTELSPAADQFAFCVSLWEALCGARPYEGKSYPELFFNASQGRLQPPPKGSRMPGWLRRALERGLSPEPADRWPSTDALLQVLERGRRRWRWQLGLAAAVVLAVPVGVSAVEREKQAREHRAAVEACEVEGREIEDTWNDTERQRLREGMVASGASFAIHDFDILEPWLDEYAEAWRSARAEACLHANVEEDWEAEILDRSAWCLEDRQLQLEATVNQIAGADRGAARRAVRLASYLDPVETCLDPKLLNRLPVPPLAMRDEVRAIRVELTKSDKLRHGGQSSEAAVVARQARIRAETLDWPSVYALARFLEGRSLWESGELTDADAVLVDAYFAAKAAGSEEVAFRAARSLVTVQVSLARYREAEVWSRHAQTHADGLPDPGRLNAAEHHYLLLRVQLGLGNLEAAAEHGEQALALRSALLGDRHPLTAAVQTHLGRVDLAAGRPEAALRRLEVSYSVWRDAVGADHPHFGRVAVYRGQALLALGSAAAAASSIEEGLDALQAKLPADHGAVLQAQRVLDEARAAAGAPTPSGD